MGYYEQLKMIIHTCFRNIIQQKYLNQYVFKINHFNQCGRIIHHLITK